MSERQITLPVSNEVFEMMDEIHRHFGINKSEQTRVILDKVLTSKKDLIHFLKDSFANRLDAELERIIKLEKMTKEVLHEQDVS